MARKLTTPRKTKVRKAAATKARDIDAAIVGISQIAFELMRGHVVLTRQNVAMQEQIFRLEQRLKTVVDASMQNTVDIGVVRTAIVCAAAECGRSVAEPTTEAV